jgi:hypothetical protein
MVVSFLRGMSLRQVYFRLGIATEPKSLGRAVVLRPVPRHATLAVRLLGVLEAKTDQLPPELQKGAAPFGSWLPSSQR